VNTTIIYRLLSMVLLALTGGFFACATAGMLLGESVASDSIQAFLVTIGTALGLAAIFHILGRKGEAKLFRREALCAIGLSWILATLVGALPYALTETGGSWADAIFESASGLTTTGATAYSNFYEFPKSLLLWRSLSQWIGGLGVVVFFVAILSSLGAGAKILFSNESSGASSDFDQGRIQSGAFQLLIFYLGVSVACLSAYKLAGMNWFQAVNHMMTTVSTGGFSTEAMSMEQFQSPLIEWIAIFFMIVCGTTFVWLIRLLRGQTHVIRKNNEAYWFFIILIVTTLLLMLFLVDQTGSLPGHDSLRTAAFQAVSIMTTTGYSTTDFAQWLPPAQMVLLLIMFVGGCSGSTSGGVKVVRIVIAVRAAMRSIIHAFRPNVTIPMRMSGQTLGERAIHSVVLFIILMTAIQLSAMLFVAGSEPELSFAGVFSCVQATLFNIGPGFAEVGPAENFQFLRSSTKVFLALLMILGRLELYAVLVLFIPATWKRFS
jgi:trk system potassium uptake protein TrkH